ncbi:MAG: hypothetical protein HQM09_08510 [Candidatus Riflebacteria bacterium]|nr:hypothetical protein [Candidatus Riflebacteria bacterium]
MIKIRDNDGDEATELAWEFLSNSYGGSDRAQKLKRSKELRPDHSSASSAAKKTGYFPDENFRPPRSIAPGNRAARKQLAEKKERFSGLATGEIQPIYNASWQRIDLVKTKVPGELHPGLGCEPWVVAFGTSRWTPDRDKNPVILKVCSENHPFLERDTFFLLKSRLRITPADVAFGSKPHGMVQESALEELLSRISDIDRVTTFSGASIGRECTA